MREIQQEILCALLRTLLNRDLITQDIHDKSKAPIQSWRFLAGGTIQKRMIQRIWPVPVGISVGNGE